MEGKIRQKATDLEKRERKIVDLEEELSKKIGEVSRALTGKEEEIINIKRRHFLHNTFVIIKSPLSINYLPSFNTKWRRYI